MSDDQGKTKPAAFWDDLAEDLQDPEFFKEYAAASRAIALHETKESS